jgi:hypothetical protein
VQADRRLVQMESTIHVATVVNTGRKDIRTDLKIKEPNSVFQCSKFMMSIDITDKYLSFYSDLGKLSNG